MADKKIRESWEYHEKEILINLIEKRIKLGHNSDKESKRRRSVLIPWNEVHKEFCALTGCSRNAQRIKEQWGRMKAHAKWVVTKYRCCDKLKPPTSDKSSDQEKPDELSLKIEKLFPHEFSELNLFDLNKEMGSNSGNEDNNTNRSGPGTVEVLATVKSTPRIRKSSKVLPKSTKKSLKKILCISEDIGIQIVDKTATLASKQTFEAKSTKNVPFTKNNVISRNVCIASAQNSVVTSDASVQSSNVISSASVQDNHITPSASVQNNYPRASASEQDIIVSHYETVSDKSESDDQGQDIDMHLPEESDDVHGPLLDQKVKKIKTEIKQMEELHSLKMKLEAERHSEEIKLLRLQQKYWESKIKLI